VPDLAAMESSSFEPDLADISSEMTNICRCGTYNRVRAAIKLAAGVSNG
jgi:isoquinoline 1-oxidoreductase alpha subunit